MKLVDAFKIAISQVKATRGKGIKISTLKQILQRLPIALPEVKADNTSESLLNEIRQIYQMYRTKEVTRKVYDSIMNSIKV